MIFITTQSSSTPNSTIALQWPNQCEHKSLFPSQTSQLNSGSISTERSSPFFPLPMIPTKWEKMVPRDSLMETHWWLHYLLADPSTTLVSLLHCTVFTDSAVMPATHVHGHSPNPDNRDTGSCSLITNFKSLILWPPSAIFTAQSF